MDILKNKKSFFYLLFFSVLFLIFPLKKIFYIHKEVLNNFNKNNIILKKNIKFKERFQKLLMEYERIKKLLIFREEIISINSYLAKLCKINNITNYSLALFDTEKYEYFSKTEFKINLSGDYKNIRKFLYDCENNFPYIIFKDINYVSFNNKQVEISLNGVIITKL